MAKDEEIKNSQNEEAQQEPSEETQPKIEERPDTSPQAIGEDQIASLKKDISQDVSGRVSEEVSKSVIQKIGDALGLTKKQEEGLPKDQAGLEKVLEQKLNQKFESFKKQQVQEQEEVTKQRQDKIQGIVSSWNSQYDYLVKTGKAPEIKNASDNNDPGVRARRALITTIGQMIEKNKNEGIEYTPTIQDAMMTNPRAIKGVAGADLPISGNTNSIDSGDDFKYDELHGNTFEQIIAQGLD